MRILVISPIASHPEDQGNSVRIAAIGRQLQLLGHIVHFVYYPLEGLTQQQRITMSKEWDYFHTLPCQLPNTARTLGDFFGVDDWYDPKLGAYVADLHEKWAFDAAIVNYVWFSRALESLPDSVLKVVDTHDIFGDRHKRFAEIGLEPEWFYTTVDEERRGLTRAHRVWGIQDEESSYLRDLLHETSSEVYTVGHISPSRFQAERPVRDRPIVGYLGSGNPFNVSAMRKFAETLQLNGDLVNKYQFVIAGSICDKIDTIPPFKVLGRVNTVEQFYAQVDVVINPMNSGTGLKIKTLEALSFGLPFIGTPSALVGIPCIQLGDESAYDDLLVLFENSSTVLNAASSKATFIEYGRTQLASLKKNFPVVI